MADNNSAVESVMQCFNMVWDGERATIQEIEGYCRYTGVDDIWRMVQIVKGIGNEVIGYNREVAERQQRKMTTKFKGNKNGNKSR